MGQKGHGFDTGALRAGAGELTHEAQALTRDVMTAPFQLRTYRLIRKILIGFILVSIANVVFSYFFYTPKMYRILRDNRETVIKYRILQDRIRSAQQRVDEIRHRDNYVYRSLFSTDTLSILILKVPDGAWTSTISPSFRPISAAPIGDLQEILPSSRFISCGLTMVYVILALEAIFVNSTLLSNEI